MNKPIAPPPDSGIAHILTPRMHDLGDGFVVARLLPAIEQRTVGPYVFLDQFGPAEFAPGKAMDVRPHPHIGLATVTYLYDGEIMHRDSLGNVQPIKPGELNWMTSGRGIVHSERTPVELRNTARTMAGLQFWVGLPTAREEMMPTFAHYEISVLPRFMVEGAAVRVAVGTFMGRRSPVVTESETLLVNIDLPAGASFAIPAEHRERAVLATGGEIEIGGMAFAQQRLIVLEPGRTVTVSARAAARCVVFGGDPLDGPRHLFWNFCHSSKERIEQAKADWKAGRFPRIAGETEFIPLPE